MIRLVLLTVLCLMNTGVVWAADVGVVLRMVPEYHEAERDSLFYLPDSYAVFNERISRQTVELNYRRNGLSFLGTAGLTVAEGERADSEGIINELYYDAQVLGQDISFGKKIMSWGVGFGFRPLDVIQREARRRLYFWPLEGTPLLAWEHFSADSAWTLVYANPLRGEATERQDDESLALKYYRLLDQVDLHGVARLSERHKLEVGAGFAHVVSDNLSWHGSFLVQQRYQKTLNALIGDETVLLSAADPTVTQTFDDGIKALLGFSWTWDSGMSFLAETWYDSEGYSEQEWQALQTLTQRQRALLAQNDIPQAAVYGNIAYNMAYFGQPNLLKQNVLLRLSYDGEKLDPTWDVQYTPEDGGWVSTIGLKYEGNRHRLDMGLRRFGGDESAAYRLLPRQWSIFVGWQWAVM